VPLLGLTLFVGIAAAHAGDTQLRGISR